MLNPMAGRPGLPGNDEESTAAAKLAANSGLWTLGFRCLDDTVIMYVR